MRTPWKAVVLLSLAGCQLVACETEEPITPEEAAAYVDQWAPTVEQSLSDRSEGASVQRELTAVVQAARSKEQAKTTREAPPFAVFVDDVYAAREYKPHLVQRGKLSPAGEAVWAEIQAVENHALDPKHYPLAEVGESVERLKGLSAGVAETDLSADDQDRQWAVNWLVTQTKESFPLTEENREKLTDELLAGAQGARLKGVMADAATAGEKVAGESARLEHALASGYARFAYDMRHAVRTMFIHPRHDDFYNDPEIRRTKERKGGDLGAYKAGVMWRRAARVAESMANHTETQHKRVKKSLEELFASEDPVKTARALWPAQPQYAALVKERARYRKIVDAGGWEEVERDKKLSFGQKKPVVAKLKKRLQIEGYFPAAGAEDERFDNGLKEAIIAYQTTHQMEVDGKTHRTFWKSINVSADKRLWQIEINLKRWRESAIRHEEDPQYVFINIPDFHAEAWADGQREMRFAVVVGNNDVIEDEETGEKEKANRTPYPIAAYIDRAIYNPFWNVTPRIRQEEILPEVEKYVRKQYEALKAKANPKPLDSLLPVSTTGAAAAEPAPRPPLMAPAAAPAQPKPADAGLRSISDPVLKSPAQAALDSFPYFNAELGDIDVSTTHPDHVPGWYAENNYEVMHAGKAWEYVRMTPGEHNALGYVKVIFPNLHDVYLHDTNAKALFSRPIRAFSHGCMRMHKPLEFAEYLLRKQGLWEEAGVPEALKSGEYLPVFLKKQVPVFVEYYTVRVDDDGRANFLVDIYDADEQGIIVPKSGTKKRASAP